MKLTIENKTDVNGRDLRALFNRIAKSAAPVALKPGALKLTVTNARGDHATVRAGGRSIRLRIPKVDAKLEQVAQALTWGVFYCFNGKRVAPENPWGMSVEIDGLQLRRKAPPAKKSKAVVAAERDAENEAKAKAKVKEIRTKLRRLQTSLAKWEKKADYYERKRSREAELRSPAWWAKLAADAERDLRYSEAAGHWLAAAGCSPTEERRDRYETNAERCLKRLDARASKLGAGLVRIVA